MRKTIPMVEQSKEMMCRQPMVPIVLAVLCGILTGDQVPASLPVMCTVALLLLCCCIIWRRRRLGWLLAMLFAIGWLDVLVHEEVISPFDLRHLLGGEPQLVTLAGTVRQPPATRMAEREGEQLWRTMVVVRVEALRHKTEWEAATGDVAVTTAGDLSGNLFTGQRIRVTGVMQRPPSARAEGLFDYRNQLSRHEVYFQLAAEGPSDWEIVGTEGGNLLTRWRSQFQDWARATLARGLPQEDESLRLLWAMTLGWRAALTDEVSEPFMKSGTMHIFAISGLHVALIAAVLVQLLRMIQMPRVWCGVVAIPLLWFYAAATGWQPSAVRSTIMATVVIAGWSLKRPGDLLNSLAAAALIILLWEPQQLFMASFQLSFAVVLSIALWLPHFERVRLRLLQSDPFLPPELRPRWQRWLDVPIRFLTTSFATSLAAWLGSMPLVACYFHLLTPVSLLANLIIVPLSALALMSCCGSLLFGAWLPSLSILFNHSAWFWMWLMQHASRWCADLPGAWFPVPAPTAAVFMLYYVVLLAVVTRVAFHRSNWKWLGPAVAVPLVFVIVRLISERNSVRLDILAARGGEAIVLDAPGRSRDWLIDCATEPDVAATVGPFLQAHGFKRITSLLLTHGDHRHVSGFSMIDSRFQPARVFTSGLNFRSPAYRSAVAALARDQARWHQVYRGDVASPWAVLHPVAGDRFSLADDGALVLRGDIHGVRLLLLSDLGSEGQQSLLERTPDLKADIVIAGTPTQNEPLRDELLQAIKAQLIIISAAEFPAGERPSVALRQRLAAARVPTIYTLDSGSVTLRFTQGRCDVNAMDGKSFTVSTH